MRRVTVLGMGERAEPSESWVPYGGDYPLVVAQFREDGTPDFSRTTLGLYESWGRLTRKGDCVSMLGLRTSRVVCSRQAPRESVIVIVREVNDVVPPVTELYYQAAELIADDKLAVYAVYVDAFSKNAVCNDVVLHRVPDTKDAMSLTFPIPDYTGVLVRRGSCREDRAAEFSLLTPESPYSHRVLVVALVARSQAAAVGAAEELWIPLARKYACSVLLPRLDCTETPFSDTAAWDVAIARTMACIQEAAPLGQSGTVLIIADERAAYLAHLLWCRPDVQMGGCCLRGTAFIDALTGGAAARVRDKPPYVSVYPQDGITRARLRRIEEWYADAGCQSVRVLRHEAAEWREAALAQLLDDARGENPGQVE